MTKLQFILALNDKLSGLPRDEVEERLSFYSEMIDDRIEEGLSEEEAVDAVGSVDGVAEQILQDIPLAKIAKERIKPKRRLGAWEILLIVLGFPIWFSLLIAAFAIVLSVYATLWSCVVSLWAVFASFVACGVVALAVGVVFMFVGKGLTGVVLTGSGLVCLGLGIITFFGCKAATKGCAYLTGQMAVGIKKCFVKKKEEK